MRSYTDMILNYSHRHSNLNILIAVTMGIVQYHVRDVSHANMLL